MELIQDQIFYHIYTKKNYNHFHQWEKGQTIFIGQQKNPFFAFFDNGLPENDGNVNNLALHYMKAVRELIFEEVRTEFFPGHPSRNRCIWVIPDNEHISVALRYWIRQVANTNPDAKIAKLNLTGKLHRANQMYLGERGWVYPFDAIRQNAFKYWTGVNGVNSHEDECLFEGFINIEEIYDPSEFGIAFSEAPMQ